MSNFVFDPVANPELTHVRDRMPDAPGIERVYFGDGKNSYAQGADVNEAFSREAASRRAIGDLIAKDGDILNGCAIVIDQTAGTVTITEGMVYLLGRPRPVQQAVLTGVPMTGQVAIGLFVQQTIVTADDDSQFLGLEPDTSSYGEAGAVRTRLSFAWGIPDDGTAGDFYLVTTLQDGVEIAAKSPTTLSGIEAIAGRREYERDGNFVVRGMDVTAVSLDGNILRLSVAAGTADVLGAKIEKRVDTPLEYDTAPNLQSVTTEPHTYLDNGDGTATIRVNHPPIAAISSVVVTKQRTVTVVKGAGNGSDLLPNTSVSTIVSVVQGGTTYVKDTAYKLTADAVDWSLIGPEPASGSSYDVTYQYLDVTPVISFTYDRVKVAGGVAGKPCFVSYDFKLPRTDRLLLAKDGTLSYLPGQPSPTNPRPPVEPVNGLSLAVIKHDWISLPKVESKKKRMTSDEQISLRDEVKELKLLVGLNRLQTMTSGRNPGKTLGMFVDPFNDDSYRDAGEVQDAATVSGSLQLAVDTTVIPVSLAAHAMLAYVNEVTIEQALATTCYRVNEYQNFNPLPYKMTLSPARDFWVEYQTNRLSTETQVFGDGNESRVTSVSSRVSVASVPLATLRQISINFLIEGMGAGETLTDLTFDGVNVNPGGIVADANGRASGSFVIPAGRSAGTKEVLAHTGSGRNANASFTGQGTLQISTVQDVVTVERFWNEVFRSLNSGGNNGNADPQAQTFAQVGGRHVGAVNLKFCAIGDRTKPVVVEIRPVTEDSQPSNTVLAEAWVPMTSVQTGVWTQAIFSLPPYQPADTMYCFVVKTDDPDHAIYGAELKKFDPLLQRWVTAQPYTAGDRFDGSNGRSWLVHPESDLTFQVLSPVFGPTSRTVPVGTFAVVGISDIQIVADIFLPTVECSVLFDVTVGTKTYTVVQGQTIELEEFFTGNIVVVAKLIGTVHASPMLKRDLQILTGKIRTAGTYIGLVWSMGDMVNLQGSLSVKLPGDATAKVYVDKGDDAFTLVPVTASIPIDEGFTEIRYALANYAAPNGGRIKVALTGGPGARPSVCDLNFSVGA